MPNPNEIARLEEELEHWKEVARNPSYTRSARELALTHVREIEAQLGIKGASYNSSEF